MKILGIHPQERKLDTKIQHAVSEPYGLEMVLAIAKQDGHDVDLCLSDEETAIRTAIDQKPDILAFSIYTSQFPRAERIATAVKKINPETVVVAGNRYPTFLKEGIEEPFDFFVVKEGEQTFRELLVSMQNGRPFESVKGLVFRKNGKGIFTGDRQRNFDLDSLPDALRFPELLSQTYKGISIPPLSKNPKYAIVESSRCCYNNCKFCDNTEFWGNKVAFRSPEKVVDEMFRLKEKGIDIFYFMDLNFTAFPEKAKELCDLMASRDLDASWYCMSNTATVDKSPWILERMKQAGCYKIAWGVESTSDSALEKMDKRVGKEFTTNSQTKRVLHQAQEAGILNQGYYIIGFPWDTEETIIRDAQKLRHLDLHQLNIGIFTPIVLSRFYRELSRENEIDPDLEKHDRNTLVFSHPSLTNETIKPLQQKIYDDFYDAPEYSERIKTLCAVEPKFRKSFNDYFEFLGKEVRV